MPEVSRFFGIVITMLYEDYKSPCFHVNYNEHNGVISTQELSAIEGELPPRVFDLVLEWASQHQAELSKNWELAKQRKALNRIAPLE